MMLWAATLIVAFASATAETDKEVQVVHYYNGNVVPQGSAMSNVMEAAAARASALANGMSQQTASDRSLIIPKVIALKAIKKHKKHKKGKKNPFKSPLKALPALFPLFGGAAIASAAATAANGAKVVAPLPGPVTYTAPVPQNIDIPVWKVHKYNGIDIRPVRLSEIVPLPPPSEVVEVIPEAPKEVIVPAPVYGPPAETYGLPPADTITFPDPPVQPASTYGVPAQSYGVPAQSYGVPAQTYGVPAQTYSVPAQTYNVPAQTYTVPAQTFSVPPQQYQVPSQTFVPVQQVSQASPAGPEELPQPVNEAATAESLEALSNLGALTDFIPGGGDSSSLLPSLFGVGTQNRGIPSLSFFNRFIRGPQSADQTVEAPVEESTGPFRQPSQSAIQNLLGRIPIISSLTNFGNANPAGHVNIPPLPELPALPDIQNVRGPNVQIPQIPHIRLPTRYIVKGSPYITIRTPQSTITSQPVIPSYQPTIPEPVTHTEAPVVEPVEPVKPEPSYPLPLEQPQPNPQPQYGLINSYGQPVQTGYYVTPVITGPAPPQFAVPYYPPPTVGVPAATYGPPGADSSVAASEIDSTTVADCADDKACSKGVLKVVVPEGVTRAMVSQTVVATSPVFKRDEAKQVPVEDMAKYLDPRHVAAKAPSVSSVDGVDAQPSTNTDADEAES